MERYLARATEGRRIRRCNSQRASTPMNVADMALGETRRPGPEASSTR
jgi:hypothetical protein